MSSLSESLARLQEETESLAARVAGALASRPAGGATTSPAGISSGDRGLSALGNAGGFDRGGASNGDETQRAVERCAAAVELLAAALDGGRLRVVLDDPDSLTARYS